MHRSLSVFSLVLCVAALATAATIPSGTKLKVRITDDAETLARSFQFHAELTQDVAVSGKVVLPRGTTFVGERNGTSNAAGTVELVLIRLPERDYPIVTSSILVGGSKAPEAAHRRQDAMQSAVDAVRGAINPRPEDTPNSPPVGSGSEVKALVPQQILQFKLRKAVTIDEKPANKKVVTASANH